MPESITLKETAMASVNRMVGVYRDAKNKRYSMLRREAYCRLCGALTVLQEARVLTGEETDRIIENL